MSDNNKKVIRTVVGKVEYVWKCTYCGTENGGLKRECTNCGRPRDKDITFNTSKIKSTFSHESEHAKKLTGPDWHCQYCDSLNPNSQSICKSCGQPREAVSQNYFELKQARIEKDQAERARHQEQLRQQNLTEDTHEELETAYINKAVSNIKAEKLMKTPVARSKKRFTFSHELFTGCLIAVGILALISLMVMVFKPHTETVNISAKNWSRSISIQELKTLKSEGWTPPINARILDQVWKFKEKTKVFDHYDEVTVMVTKTRQVEDGYDITYEYTDDGNGTGDIIEVKTPKYKTETYQEPEVQKVAVYRDEDVYDWWYTYEYDEWQTTRYVDTQGGDTEPYWGEVILYTKEREGVRSETYKITGINQKDKNVTYKLSYEDWLSINIDTTVKLKINGILGTAHLIENDK